MRRATLLVVLVAFVFSCGGQWPVLQCVAWVNMVREYSEMVPLAKAVQMTFSGQYPCALCKAIAEKRTNDTKAATFSKQEKKLFCPSLIAASPVTLVASRTFIAQGQSLVTRSDRPPTPPPRLA